MALGGRLKFLNGLGRFSVTDEQTWPAKELAQELCDHTSEEQPFTGVQFGTFSTGLLEACSLPVGCLSPL